LKTWIGLIMKIKMKVAEQKFNSLASRHHSVLCFLGHCGQEILLLESVSPPPHSYFVLG
jgi:hypothetical protein